MSSVDVTLRLRPSVSVGAGNICYPATYTLINTATPPATLDSGSIAAGGGETIVAPPASWSLENTDGDPLDSGTIPSNESALITAPDADVTINSAPFASVPSGDPLDIPVVNGGDNPVGSEQGGEWVIGNSEVFINAVQVADIVAEDTANLAVELDGVPSGTWNAGTQTWEVTSVPCPQDLTIRVQVALAADAFTFTATTNEAGTITSVNNGGLSSFVLSKNASPVTAPFTIANGDVISAAFTAAGAATTVILTGTY
jgi:hypothetical protein